MFTFDERCLLDQLDFKGVEKTPNGFAEKITNIMSTAEDEDIKVLLRGILLKADNDSINGYFEARKTSASNLALEI